MKVTFIIYSACWQRSPRNQVSYPYKKISTNEFSPPHQSKWSQHLCVELVLQRVYFAAIFPSFWTSHEQCILRGESGVIA